MLILNRLRYAFVYLWKGPEELPQSLKLEWRFVAVRWIGILFLAPALLLTNLAPERLLAAYAVLFVAAVYNVVVQRVMRHRPKLFANGYVTAFADSMLDVAMVLVGGGFDSPFYFILFTVTMSAAMRYGYGPSLATALIFVGFDIIEDLPRLPLLDASFVFRSGFLCMTPILASYLREQTHRAEAALQERLRQADLLNELTATLGASLEFEPVLHSVVAAASNLFGCEEAVLRPSPGLDDDPLGLQTIIHYPAQEDSALHQELAELCNGYSSREKPLCEGDRSYYLDTLPSGEQAIVLILSLPTRQISLATLALALPAGQSVPNPHPDILGSFIERITLAVENASLYRTLARRSNDLQRAYTDLARAHQELLGIDEMKTNFLANVSHELRTPLSSIRAFSELLLSYENDAEVQKEFLHIINSESERLTRLVNDVLDITKIESGHMNWDMSSLDVSALLRESARTYGPLIEKHNLVFEESIADNIPPVYGDRDRLQQVIANLLNNAAKFTPHGAIKLSAICEGDEVLISVKDSGIGIAPHDQERIFEKFQQVGAMLTDKPHGTGLGLAISRDIIVHHKGRLWVDSELGVGSTFIVALPVSAECVQLSDEESNTADSVAA